MRRVAFVACAKTKGPHAMPAGALYSSPLYRKSLLAAIDSADKVYILSALHGVLDCNQIIPPYDLTLKTMSRAARVEWGEKVGAQLAALLKKSDEVIVIAGEEYFSPIEDYLAELSSSISLPLRGLSLGERLRDLAEINREVDLHDRLDRFTTILKHLWRGQHGGRLIGEMHGRQEWPQRGVYFMLEGTQHRGTASMPRVVRVGTHAVSMGSRTRLWNRLSTHRGTESGGGSHRSSIFRLHVGQALMNSAPSAGWPSTWASGQSAMREIREAENTLEQEVSRTIGALRVLWVDVPDEASSSSHRAYIEQNAISLLSRAGLLRPKQHSCWLGSYSPNWRIAASGLWNLNHVFGTVDDGFLDMLNTYVHSTLGTSLARSLSANSRRRRGPRQLALKIGSERE